MYDKFRQLTEERGITAYRVSKDTEIPYTTFSDWKRGRSNPKIDKLMILANYFNVPLAYFTSTN